MIKTYPLVSVIVPVYNTEQYIERCIDSIVKQKYRNIEIVIINDGSTDNSLEICERYTAVDMRIKIVSQENRGLSCARNKGIEEATGQYLLFVDSDDWLDDCIVSNMVEVVNSNGSDVVICDYYMTDQFTALEKVAFSDINKEEYDCHEAVKNLFLNGFYYSHATGKLYRRELWQDVVFPAGKKYEDLFTIPSVISKAHKTTYIKYYGYYYYIRAGSILNIGYSKNDNDYLAAYKYNIEYFAHSFSDILPYIRTKWCEAYICVYNKIINSGEESISKEFIHEYYNTFLEYSKKYKKESLNIKYLLMIKIMRIDPKLYGFLLGKLIRQRKYDVN